MTAQRWPSRPLYWMGTIAAVLVASACGDDPVAVIDSDWQLEFIATFDGRSTGISTACSLVSGPVDGSRGIEPGWTASLSMSASRTAAAVTISDDAVPLDFKLEAVDHEFDDDVVNIIVSGSYSDTIQGRRTSDGHFRGAWICDEDFLYAEDPALLATGYQPLAPISGLWALSPLSSP